MEGSQSVPLKADRNSTVGTMVLVHVDLHWLRFIPKQHCSELFLLKSSHQKCYVISVIFKLHLIFTHHFNPLLILGI